MTTPTSPHSKGNRPPAKSTGWLKATLAGSGIALTVLGTGLIAREAAGQTPNTVTVSETTVDASNTLPAIPTVVAPSGSARFGRNSTRSFRQQLQAPGQFGQSFQMPGFAQSRSSR